MAPDVRVVGRHLVLIMVAFAAGLQTTIQAAVDLYDGRNFPAGLWTFGTLLIVMATVSSEKVKRFLGD